MTDTKDTPETLTRRQAIVAGIGGAAALAATPALVHAATGAQQGGATTSASKGRLPVVFLPHGGGPWPFVEMGLDKGEVKGLADYLRSVRNVTPQKPKALLVISAHWEEAVPTVMTSAAPPMLYDYYGFPPASYTLTWPAPGAPALAARVQDLLGAAGFKTATDDKRGFDHGTFVPLKLTYPDADVPTIQLSLVRGLDPDAHLRMGRALAPLRDEGVLIIGSGMTYHNMRGFGDPRSAPIAESFDAWLRETASLEESERSRRLIAWEKAPSARQAHPREEHLVPLMVVAGAAGADRATTDFNGTMFGLRLSAYRFG